MKFTASDLFPVQSKISFNKVIESLESQAKDPDENVAAFARNLLKEAEKYPVLKEGFDDYSLLEKYKPIISRLLRTLYPDALHTNEIKGVSAPFVFKPFYYSTRLKKIIDASGTEQDFEPKGFGDDDMYIFSCCAILSLHYHYPVNLSMPLYVEIPNKQLGFTRTYRLAYNADMFEFIPTKKARSITKDDYHELLDNFHNLPLWKEKFPPGSWIIRGIGVVNLMDVTLDQSVANITTNLLSKTPDSTLKIWDGIKTLFNNPHLRVGFTAYHNDMFVKTYKDNIDSMILGEKESLFCNDVFCDLSYQRLMELRSPLVVSDMEKFCAENKSNMSQMLKQQNIQSFIAVPMMHEGEFLGLLELGSPNKYDLNESSMSRLNMILPTLSVAVNRFSTEFQNSIEAIIQEECTTIHPSVKWRFEEEACEYLLKKQRGETPHFQDLSFNDVFPLYGQLDIRDSSVKRNEAVQADLLTQLNGVKTVLQKAFIKKPLPAYEELIFRVKGYKDEIEKGLLAGSELMVHNFFKTDVYPVFEHLKQTDTVLAKAVEAYEKTLDVNLKFLYRKRKTLDESMTEINHALSTFIDKKQEDAQRMFPHYFERYKTDGLEYNMYIGQSITKNQQFHPVYLQSLRLWQLIVMCEMENEYRQLQQKLESKLDIASLILVYGTPLSIHFRLDEKRFDVEGAYNARYEIVKKRVDKAYIQGTRERITQPGKIAIIYSHDHDAREYRKYIKFLQSRNYLSKTVEDHELQDLQGITGLRALRVEVVYHDVNSKKENLTVDKIIEAIEKN